MCFVQVVIIVEQVPYNVAALGLHTLGRLVHKYFPDHK
jgi:ligand-binding SRPBCC domain-containing protein